MEKIKILIVLLSISIFSCCHKSSAPVIVPTRCMDPLPAVEEVTIPEPPTPDGPIVLPKDVAQKLRKLIMQLSNYIEEQYAKCGRQ